MKSDFELFVRIYAAVAHGRPVKWKNSAYSVIRDNNGQFMIVHSNGSAVGLHEPSYNVKDFYLAEGQIRAGVMRLLMENDSAFEAAALYSLEHNDPYNLRITLRAFGFEASPESGDCALEMVRVIANDRATETSTTLMLNQ